MLAHHQFIGSERAAVAMEGFTLGRWVADPCGRQVKAHGHADAHLMLAVGGAYETDADGALDPGRPAFIYNPSWVEHRDRFLTPGWFFSLSISPERLARAGTAIRLPDSPTILSQPGAHAAVRRLLAACAAGAAEALLEPLCLELLGSVAAPETADAAPPAWLKRAAEALREQPQARIDALAREAGVHPVHLARAFRRFYGCAPGEYLRGERLERAARLLGSARRPVAEVALDCGFADQSHFTHRFTAAYGVSPARFRRALNRHV